MTPDNAFYNEIDPYAAQWLRNLIDAGHIAPGIVDERPIQEIEPHDLEGFTQCHFFAGIGIWSAALRRAGWPDERPVWTGSCPCQPFSAAGKQEGFDDERHLWPTWFTLLEKRRPAIVIGEQVASALAWLDLVQADMEGAGYAFGAADLCAAGFDGAHIRQRLYFVGLANADGRQSGKARAIQPGGQYGQQPQDDRASSGLADSASGRHGANNLEPEQGRRERAIRPDGGELLNGQPATHAPMLGRHAVDWLFCRDGKWRPTEPGFFEVAYETSCGLGCLCAAANTQTERLVNEASKRFSISREEILREMRAVSGTENIQRETGGAFFAQEAQVLLASLFEFHGQAWREQDAANGTGAHGASGHGLRMLWRDGESRNPSCERGLDQQSNRKLTDAMRTLSSTMAWAAQEVGYPMQYTHAAATFPLAGRDSNTSQNRVGRLRAYGNSLDLETAAQFVGAVMEARP